jgi:hypothetical protein
VHPAPIQPFPVPRDRLETPARRGRQDRLGLIQLFPVLQDRKVILEIRGQ